MKSFVINLASATERMARMKRILDESGVQFVRFDAIDRESAELHPDRKRIPAKRGRDWSPSELGCLLSHVGVWRQIAAGREPFSAVFEDDIHIDAAGLGEFLSTPLEGNIEVVKIETVFSGVKLGRRSGGLRLLESLHTGSGAYIVSKQAAQHLVANIAKFDLPVDHVLFDPSHPIGGSLIRYQCSPALAVQDCVLPPEKQIGGDLSSGMTDRPIFGGEPRPPRGPLWQRALRAPRTVRNMVGHFVSNTLLQRSEVVQFSGTISR